MDMGTSISNISHSCVFNIYFKRKLSYCVTHVSVPCLGEIPHARGLWGIMEWASVQTQGTKVTMKSFPDIFYLQPLLKKRKLSVLF